MMLCLAIDGCAASSGGAPGLPPVPAAFTFVEIDNRHWSPVTIYAVRDGMRQRLGVAITARRTTFRVPPHALDGLGRLTLQAVPDGAAAGITTESVRVAAGQRVAWTLSMRLEQSSLAVW